MKEVIELAEKSLLKKPIEEIVRNGAQRILQHALEIEIENFIQRYTNITIDDGMRRIVRNGYHKERTIQTKADNVLLKVPRVRDREENPNRRVYYQSKLIPPYLRRTKDLNEFIPYLYLKGISTNDFSGVLTELLGEEASISPSTVVKLKESWRKEYKD